MGWLSWLICLVNWFLNWLLGFVNVFCPSLHLNRRSVMFGDGFPAWMMSTGAGKQAEEI